MSGFVCNECDWHGEDPGRITLYAIPDMGAFNLVVCPNCRHLTSSLVKCCEEPGCRNESTCGTPIPGGGYKFHCHKHPPNPPDQGAAPAPLHPVVGQTSEDAQ